MSIKRDELNKMIDNAKDKKDGIYAYQGHYYYVVQKNNVTYLGNRITGEVFQLYFGLVSLGNVKTWELKNKLKELANSKG